MNYYKDQQDDLEKYKLICRFVNPEAARSMWDKSEPANESAMFEDEFLSEIRQHTTETKDNATLLEKLQNPIDDDFDTIERVD